MLYLILQLTTYKVEDVVLIITDSIDMTCFTNWLFVYVLFTTSAQEFKIVEADYRYYLRSTNSG